MEAMKGTAVRFVVVVQLSSQLKTDSSSINLDLPDL